MSSSKRPIRTFSNGDSLEYDTGVFDNWCTYLCKPDGTRNPPRDAELLILQQRKDITTY